MLESHEEHICFVVVVPVFYFFIFVHTYPNVHVEIRMFACQNIEP